VLRFHRLLGQLPLALHPDPRRALVIGLGGGATPGAMSRQAGVEIEVVELSTALVDGADRLRHVNDDVLRRPNVRLRVDDGRNYLLLASRRYDVITADIIRPFHAGAGNLYSAEYFRLASEALADDGLMAQWVDTSSETQYRLIVRTFQSVFPHTTAWADGRLLIGAKGPLRLDPGDYAQRLRDPAAREALAALGLDSADALLSLCTAGPDALRRLVGPGPLLTDDRPLIEYFLTLPPGDRPVDVARLREDEGAHRECRAARVPGSAGRHPTRPAPAPVDRTPVPPGAFAARLPSARAWPSHR
jgi:spermidine synthase